MVVIEFSTYLGVRGCPATTCCSRTELARHSAGPKTLMFADNLSALLSANAAICPMLIILLSSRAHTHKPTHRRTHKPANTRTAQHSVL